MLADSDDEHSIAGDSVCSSDDGCVEIWTSASFAAAASSTRGSNATPIRAVDGDVDPERTHAERNSEFEVGNFGLHFGNWGTRGESNKRNVKARREASDRQILKAPSAVTTLAEASFEIEEALRQPAVAGDVGATGLDRRPTCEHWTIRGEEKSSVLIASRTDVTTGIELLVCDVHADHAYSEHGKQKMATTRTLVCRVHFKQNIGHIGLSMVVAVVHLNCKTARIEWLDVYVRFWDQLAERIFRYGINFLSGDFNMSLTEVTVQLRRRNVRIDCIAWYPWRHEVDNAPDTLGFDSCGIFYIGGNAVVNPQYGLSDVGMLTSAVAGPIWRRLPAYKGPNYPGQRWTAYKRDDETAEAKLTNLLQQSISLEALEAIPKRHGTYNCAYFRVKQKPLDAREWLINGNTLHCGAHFPLMIVTFNARARSQDAAERRGKTYRWTHWGRNTVRSDDPPLYVNPRADYQPPLTPLYVTPRPPLHVTQSANCPQSRGPSGAWDNYRMVSANNEAASSNDTHHGYSRAACTDWSRYKPSWQARVADYY